jgi:D-alanyl-D-alanine carboxypeptidase (penicillin-binding protein 5/6)
MTGLWRHLWSGFAGALLAVFTCAGAVAQTGQFVPKAKQVMLMDAASGAILFQANADQLIPPASMSKLMTLVLVFKALKAGRVKGSDPFLVSVNAWRKGGAPSGTAAMMVPVGTRESLDDLLQGMIVQSGNDAAIAVAEGLAGNEGNFAKMMNEEARRIGLTKSTFQNATGLPHPEHLSTVRDLAMIARHILVEYPTFYPLFSQKEFRYRRHRFINRNPLLFLDPTVDGFKTGYIAASGYGMVVSAKRDGRRLIAVIAGCASDTERREEARRLLDWGFASYAEFKLFDAGQEVGWARVWGGSRFYLPLTGDGDVNVVLPKTAAASGQRLKGEIIYASPLKAPIKKGEPVARLRVTSTANAVSEVPLYAAEDMEQGGLVRRGIDSLAHLAFGWMR